HLHDGFLRTEFAAVPLDQLFQLFIDADENWLSWLLPRPVSDPLAGVPLVGSPPRHVTYSRRWWVRCLDIRSRSRRAIAAIGLLPAVGLGQALVVSDGSLQALAAWPQPGFSRLSYTLNKRSVRAKTTFFASSRFLAMQCLTGGISAVR